MSLLPTALIFIPVARRWFLARRDNWPAEAFFWQLRIVFAVYVLFRFSAKFKDIPLPVEFAILTDVQTLLVVGGAFVMTTVFPGLYSADIAHSINSRTKRAVIPIGEEMEAELIYRPRQFGSAANHEIGKAVNHSYEGFVARSAEMTKNRQRVRDVSSTDSFERSNLEQVRRRRKTEIDIDWPLHISSGLFLAVVVSTIYGMRSAQFLPDAEMADKFYTYRYELSAAVFFIMFFSAPLIFPVKKSLVLRNSPVLHAILVAVFFGGSLHFAFPMAVLKGLPSFHAILGAQQVPGVALVTVVERDKYPRKKGCDFSAMVVGESYAGAVPMKVCEIDPVDWDQVSIGDTIILYGGKTQFGFRYHRAQLKRNE